MSEPTATPLPGDLSRDAGRATDPGLAAASNRVPRQTPAGQPRDGLGALSLSNGQAGTVQPFPAAGNLTDAEREELRRHGILMTSLEELYNWGRSNSIWPLQFGLACCAIEMIASATARFDIARFGAEIFRPSPRQADLMIVSGTVTKKMAPQVVRLWNQMPEPKYCIAMGACAISGGPFKQGYNVLKGIDRFIPVDIYIPGCPPRPEALLNGLIQLQEKIKGEKLSGPNAARFTRPEEPSEFPVPDYGAHDLVPPRNPDVWSPPGAKK